MRPNVEPNSTVEQHSLLLNALVVQCSFFKPIASWKLVSGDIKTRHIHPQETFSYLSYLSTRTLYFYNNETNVIFSFTTKHVRKARPNLSNSVLSDIAHSYKFGLLKSFAIKFLQY